MLTARVQCVNYGDGSIVVVNDNLCLKVYCDYDGILNGNDNECVVVES